MLCVVQHNCMGSKDNTDSWLLDSSPLGSMDSTDSTGSTLYSGVGFFKRIIVLRLVTSGLVKFFLLFIDLSAKSKQQIEQYSNGCSSWL